MSYFNISESELDGLKDKVSIITGASSGIGLATAKLFLSKGAHVVAADLQPLTEDLPHAMFIKANVSSWKELCAVFKKTMDKFGRVDVAFANAGINPMQSYLTLSDEVDADGDLIEPDSRCVKVNLISGMNTVALAVHYMKKQDMGGSIVMTASPASYQQYPVPDYTSSKHGVIGFMRATQASLYPQVPIRINCIAPSWTESGLVRIPRSAFEALNISLQPSSAVALAVGKLVLDVKYHGHTLYAANSEFREIEEEILAGCKNAMGKYIRGETEALPDLKKFALEMKAINDQAYKP